MLGAIHRSTESSLILCVFLKYQELGGGVFLFFFVGRLYVLLGLDVTWLNFTSLDYSAGFCVVSCVEGIDWGVYEASQFSNFHGLSQGAPQKATGPS